MSGISSFSEILQVFQTPLWGGTGIALLSGPLGALLVWQRLAYLGDSLAHGSLLGVGLALLFAWPVLPTTLCVTGLLALTLSAFLHNKAQPPESLLLLLTQGLMGMGLLLMTCSHLSSVDLMGYLVGDFLTLSLEDVVCIWIVTFGFFVFLFRFWRPLLAVVIHPDLAAVEGVPVYWIRIFFLCFASLSLVFTIQTTGVLLVTALLVFPVLSLSPWAKNPEWLCVGSSCLGLLSVWIGFGCSLLWNTPPGPLMTVFLFIFFLISHVASQLLKR